MGLVTSKQADATYQPKGEYALSVDLNKYQPKGSYALQSDLGNYQPKGNYALSVDLNKYQPKGNYALQSELGNYQPKGNYLVSPSGDEYTLKGYTDKTYQPKGGMSSYVTVDDFNSFRRENRDALENNLIKTFLPANYQPKGNYVTQEDLNKVVSNYVDRDLFNRYELAMKNNLFNINQRLPPTSNVAGVPVPSAVDRGVQGGSVVDRGVIGGSVSSSWKNLKSSDGWFVPIRLNSSGIVECMSANSADCYWKGTSAEVDALVANPPAEANKPLVCTDDAIKVKEHWCYKGTKELNPLSPKLPSGYIRYNRHNNYLHY